MESDRSPDTDAAEKQVEDSRNQLDRHLDQLSEKLSPSNLAASALDQINPTERIKKAAKNPSILAAGFATILSIVALRRWRKGRNRTAR